jgi:hypothetical protein
VCGYFAFTTAIPTTNRSLIIRTEIRTTIRERLKIEAFILLTDISPDYRRNRKSVKRGNQSGEQPEPLPPESVTGVNWLAWYMLDISLTDHP